MNPWLGIFVVTIAFALLMGGVWWLRQRFGLHPEVSRKAVHVGMGLVTLSFPWLFREFWPVGLLASGSLLGLLAIRFVAGLRSRLGGVLGGVARQSWGEILFPVSVAFVFWLARGDALLFCVPILILSLADAMAALIGQRYGFARYETDDGWKSIEGSAAFFFTAFLATHVPLLLASNAGRVESLLIATVMGMILMLMEAIAWRGLDNLFIPLVSYVCLVRMMALSCGELLIRAAVLIAFIVSLRLWRHQTRLTQSAVIGASLVLYVTWAVEDWPWLIAPLMTAAAYTVLCRGPVSAPKRHTVHAIACIGGCGLAWLCLANVIRTVNPVYSYGVAYATHLGMIGLAYFADRKRSGALWIAAVKAIVLGYVALAAPYLIVWRENPNAPRLGGYALLLVSAAIVAFAWWQPSLRECPANEARWTRQGVIAAIASTAAFGIISVIEPWSKSFL